MRLGVLLHEEVRVVRRDDLDPELRAEAEHRLVHAQLPFVEALRALFAGREERALDLVEHDLQVVVVAEEVLVPERRLARLVVVPVVDRLRDLARDAGGRHDEPLVVLLEQLVVDARPPVEALDVRQRDQAHEVVVAREVLRQEDQVVAGEVARVVVLEEAAAARHVGLAPEDGLHVRERVAGLVLLQAAFVVERLEGEQDAVVGDRERRHPERAGAGDERFDLARAVEQRIRGVEVEGDEWGHESEDGRREIAGKRRKGSDNAVNDRTGRSI